ncbi:hypothetical protein N7527_000122 [Penicillium freii]|nr:hypothetical protein N7527_000122 [Penicillium freii]
MRVSRTICILFLLLPRWVCHFPGSKVIQQMLAAGFCHCCLDIRRSCTNTTFDKLRNASYVVIVSGKN